MLLTEVSNNRAGSDLSRRLLLVFCTLILVACQIGALCAAEPQEQIGVVLLHGKTSRPEQHIGMLIGPLKHEHYLVEVPEMPWSYRRYLTADYDTALTEIDRAVEKLKRRGATRIIVAGHSMGANAALAYAATRRNVAGAILLAPGHFPDLLASRFAPDVATAKEMVRSGHGGKSACFHDVNQGTMLMPCTKAAVYVSYFDPEGLGAMSKTASQLSSQIPLLYVVGKQDIHFSDGPSIFEKAPHNPLSRYVVVDAGHIDTPSAAISEVTSWLHSLQASEP